MNLSEYITTYRNEHGLSQRQFAAKCLLSNGFVSMLEKNLNPNTGQPLIPSLSVYQKLASGMGMSVSDLFASIDDTPVELSESQNADGHTSVMLSTSEVSLLSSYRELNEEGQEKAADYIEDLCASGRYKKCGADSVAAKEA